MATFQGYPSLPGSDSESEGEMEGEMEGPSHPVMDGMEEMRRQFQMIQAQLAETQNELANIKRKDKENSFAQTWQEAATPETQDHFGRVVAILEHTMVEDAQLVYLNYLRAEKAAGRGDRR